MENRQAVMVDARLTLATGTAKREAELEMVAARPGNPRITLGADKAYDVASFVADLRENNLTPHERTKVRRPEQNQRRTMLFSRGCLMECRAAGCGVRR